MQIQLSDHFTYRRLLRFVYPSIIMMIFTSIYTMVDGLFVSNCLGKTSFAGINLAWPVISLLGAVGFMFGTGGSALISRTFGEGDPDRARRYFTQLLCTAAVFGVILAVIGYQIMPAVATAFGAEGETYTSCVQYGRILLCAIPAFILQNVFQSFFPAAGKPKMGLAFMILAGCTNIILDAVFIIALGLGVPGAACATALGQTAGGICPIFYFAWQTYRHRADAGNGKTAEENSPASADIEGKETEETEKQPSARGPLGFIRQKLSAGRQNESLLWMKKTKWEPRMILRACYNGISEFSTNISMSIVSMVYNAQLMKLAGEDGVDAYGVIMYVGFIFLAVFMGYGVGSTPIVGYHYGAGDYEELKSLRQKSLSLVAVGGVCMMIGAVLLAKPLAFLYVGYDADLLELTVHAFRIYSISFLLSGFNIYGSSFFTALGNGAVSAAISLSRTFIFQVIAVLVLPIFLGIDGIWLAMAAAELCALCVTAFFFRKMRGRYHYA